MWLHCPAMKFTTSPEPGTSAPVARHTAGMALRFAVQADSEQECARGLAELCERLGLRPAMMPRLLTDDRWMARAVPTLKGPPADGD